jgi:formylglycine-generating enzyme required for sulfatase activity
VSTFRLDTYQVTVGRFRQFVNAGMGTQASPPPIGAGARTLNGMVNQGGWDPAWNASLTANTAALVAAVKCRVSWQSWTDTAGANEALPMNCITWFEAFAFCAWDGGLLPTETEWNYAAAGGSEQRAYPWSNPAGSLAIDCSYANYNNGTAVCVNPPNRGVNRVGSESPKGDSKYGQAELSGTVAEWMLDWYLNPYGNSCNDCADLTAGANRVIRGGNFYAGEQYLRGALRQRIQPDDRSWGLGVRCARKP